MTALDRKLFRDLSGMKGQALAIVLVLACGVATFVMSMTTLRSLENSQQVYYTRYLFSDVFARVKRAPDAVAEEIAAIPGVARVQTRIVNDVTLDVPDMAEPVVGRVISWPESGEVTLNGLHLREGRLVEPGRTGEAVVNEGFAKAHNLRPGDRVRAILNERMQSLQIVGIALSPEYILTIQGGESLPDDKRFGVFWMNEEDLANAFDMDGAFNDVTLSLLPRANEQEVIRRLDLLLERYGAIGAYGREDQISHRFVSDEIRSLRGMGMMIPIIFLSVAAFLLSVVMTRLISTQREQIAAIKAFGYSKLEVGIHYMKFVLVISLIGAAIGVGGGLWLAQGMTALYAQFYKFPAYVFTVTPAILLIGIATAIVAASLGTLRSVRRAVQLPAAEAMRPEPPPMYGPTIAERIGLQKLLSQPTRMIMRHLERNPFKAAMSVFGISLAVAVLIVGSFFSDALEYMIEFGFYVQQRQDVMVSFVEPTSAKALHEVNRLPGIVHAEGARSVPVEIFAGHINRRTVIHGIAPDATLFRVIDEDLTPFPMPPEGLVMSDKLAEVVSAQVGDLVRIKVMEGRRKEYLVPVSGIVREYAGITGYMNVEALRRLLQEGDTITAAFMQVDATRLDELYRELKETPRVAGVSVKEGAVRSFNETQAQNQKYMQFFNLIFACIIAAGVVYNTARISLSERGRELATLRVIGFTRGEISAILLGELAVLTLLALPVGMMIGRGLVMWIAASINSESFRIPVIIGRSSNAFAALVVILAAVLSGMLVRRRLDHLDLVAVLKSKE